MLALALAGGALVQVFLLEAAVVGSFVASEASAAQRQFRKVGVVGFFQQQLKVRVAAGGVQQSCVAVVTLLRRGLQVLLAQHVQGQ